MQIAQLVNSAGNAQYLPKILGRNAVAYMNFFYFPNLNYEL